MQLQVFSIPILDGEDELNTVNKFLRSHRVVDVQKTFVSATNGGWWAICITYLENVKMMEPEIKKGKIDYRNVLEEKDFALFCEMRKIRKSISEKEGIPPFAIFTDAELAEMAKLETLSLSTIKSIPGVGAKKIEKYGAYFIITGNEADREPDEPNIGL